MGGLEKLKGQNQCPKRNRFAADRLARAYVFVSTSVRCADKLADLRRGDNAWITPNPWSGGSEAIAGLGRPPVPEPHAYPFGPLHAPDARRQIRAEEPSVAAS